MRSPRSKGSSAGAAGGSGSRAMRPQELQMRLVYVLGVRRLLSAIHV
jgi:hypothetical protein